MSPTRGVACLVALLATHLVHADFASDRGLEGGSGPLTQKIKRLYPAKTSIGRLPWERNCVDLRTAAACIKRYGEPDERRTAPEGDEILVYYGTRQLYRGTGLRNEPVGRERTEHTVRDQKIIAESEVIQVIEWGYSWTPDADTQRSCENVNGKGTRPCYAIKLVGPVPEVRPLPAELMSGRDPEKLYLFYLALISRAQCGRMFADFSPRLSRELDSLDERTRRLMAWIEESPEYAEDARWMAQNMEAMGAKDRGQAEDLCDEVPAMLAGPRAPDPRFATPEATWQTYTNALKRGDTEAAIACLTAAARSTWRPVLRKMTPDRMKSMAESIKEFSVTSSFGDMKEGLAVRHDGRAGFIYFQSRGNEWRIAEM